MHVCALGRGGCWLSTVFINLSSYTRSIVHIEATNNKVTLEEFCLDRLESFDKKHKKLWEYTKERNK